jgi:mRNA-degrading endonuclease RelE of RelBE toxin-antitoxin system
MSYSVQSTTVFERQAKRLVKKYASLKKELLRLVQALKENPRGTPIEKNCFKIRIAIASKGKGKSGGARIITNFVVPALQAVFAIAGKIAAGLSMLLMPAIDAVSAAMGPGSGLGGTIEFIDGVLNAVFPPLAAIVRGAIMMFEGLLEGVGFLIAPIKRLFGAFGELGDTGDWLTKTILYIGDYIGTAFKTLGFIIGGVIDVAASVVRWFGDIVRGSETLTGGFKILGSAIDLIRTYLSPEGFKAIYASIKEFFVNGISDFFSSFKDAMLGMMGGMLQLLGKIPGLGKLAESGKEMEKEVEDRKLAREKAATARQAEINQLHQAAADQKTQRDQKIQNHSAAIKQYSKAFGDKKIHLENTRGLNREEEDEKKKKLDEAKGVTVDTSDPIQMLKSFAAKNKSAYTQEAKALDAKEKTQSELNMSSQELAKAQIELKKAGNVL